MTFERNLITVKEAQSPLYIGVDVGGTSIKFGLIDDYGRIIDIGEVDDKDNPRGFKIAKTDVSPQVSVHLIARIIDDILVKTGISKAQIGGIGLGIPGTMDIITRKLRRPPNLSTWEGCAICDDLEEQCKLPVLFCNDANAAAYGEYWVGSASGFRSVALLTLGTGIGTGIIIDGVSIDGSNGYGGECGHLLIDISESARMCGCGQRGHFEAYASATGVARRTIELTNIRASILRETITPDTRLSEIPKLVFDAAENGDSLAIEIVEETAKYLAYGIISILNTIDPACILLGGAMTFGGKETKIGRLFLSKTKETVDRLAFKAISEKLRIDLATLGGDAGFIGAAGLARENAIQKKS